MKQLHKHHWLIICMILVMIVSASCMDVTSLPQGHSPGIFCERQSYSDHHCPEQFSGALQPGASWRPSDPAETE